MLNNASVTIVSTGISQILYLRKNYKKQHSFRERDISKTMFIELFKNTSIQHTNYTIDQTKLKGSF